MESHPENFLGIGPPHTDLARARAVLVPVPYDRTASYGKGAAEGPAALIEASNYLELYDEELGSETYTFGIHTAPPVGDNSLTPEELTRQVDDAVAGFLEQEKLVVTVGGEHSVTVGALMAHQRRFPNLTVIQLDAHADLRNAYEGSKYSHACVMRRARELFPTVSLGIRSLSQEEADYLAAHPAPLIGAARMAEGGEWLEEALEAAGEEVYVTVDLDFFDPALVPATGTPEPGGPDWYAAMTFLRALSLRSRIVGFDVVELAPLKGQPSSDFLAAKLLYRLLGYALS